MYLSNRIFFKHISPQNVAFQYLLKCKKFAFSNYAAMFTEVWLVFFRFSRKCSKTVQLLEISRFQFDPHPDYSIILTLIQFSIEFSIQFSPSRPAPEKRSVSHQRDRASFSDNQCFGIKNTKWFEHAQKEKKQIPRNVSKYKRKLRGAGN